MIKYELFLFRSQSLSHTLMVSGRNISSTHRVCASLPQIGPGAETWTHVPIPYRIYIQLTTTCDGNLASPRGSHWRNKLLLRIGHMPSIRWPTENKFNHILGGSVFHNVVPVLFNYTLYLFHFLLLFYLYIFKSLNKTL